MSQVLPPLFIAIAGLVLALALLSLWQSLRMLFLAQPGEGAFAGSSEARLALVDEKATLLKAIKELEFERDLGKISDQDYEALNARYRSRAKEVLRALDSQLGDYRKQAESVVEQELAKLGKPVAAPSSDGDAKQAQAAESAQPARAACPVCASDNDGDAVFCKKCGKRMDGGEA